MVLQIYLLNIKIVLNLCHYPLSMNIVQNILKGHTQCRYGEAGDGLLGQINGKSILIFQKKLKNKS